jgi:hypothetical protein
MQISRIKININFIEALYFMKKTTLLYFLFAVLAVQGQQFLPVQHDTNQFNQEFILIGNFDLNATSIEKAISSKMFFGGEITDDLKNRSLERHKPVNRVGVDYQSEFEWRNACVNLFKKEKYGLLIKGGSYGIGSGAYSTDLFKLAYYGNEYSTEERLNMDGSAFRFTSFQKIGVGFFNKKSKNSFSLNFVNVNSHFQGYLNKGELTTYLDADSLEILLNGNYKSTNPGFSNGIGFAIDFDIRLPINWFNEKEAVIQFQGKNLGIASMNKGLLQYSVDSTYKFEGFRLQQLMNSSTLFGNDFSLLDTLQISQTTRKSNIFLPGFIQVGKIVSEQSQLKLQSYFGIRMYPNLFYRPFVYAGLDYVPTKDLHISLNSSLGGFGLVRFGAYASYSIDGWNVGLGTEDLYSLISDRGMGSSLNIRLSKKLM